jgi:hypothetical protein
LALVDLSVVEQRYRAVLAVERGEPKIVVAAQFGRKVTNVPDCGRQVRRSPRIVTSVSSQQVEMPVAPRPGMQCG